MDKGKIKDNNTGVFYSIKLQFNSEDSWTKACRYMLTNLKWGLAWITSVHSDETIANWDFIQIITFNVIVYFW